jgi:hypothetical protein
MQFNFETHFAKAVWLWSTFPPFCFATAGHRSKNLLTTPEEMERDDDCILISSDSDAEGTQQRLI